MLHASSKGDWQRLLWRVLCWAIAPPCVGGLALLGAAAAAAARLVVVADPGPGTVPVGAPVSVELFLEIDPGERINRIQLDMSVSNLTALTYVQVPDLLLGALPNAPWGDVSFVANKMGFALGSAEVQAMHLSLWSPVDMATLAELKRHGMSGASNQVPLGGFRGFAARSGEIAMQFNDLGNGTSCASPQGECILALPAGNRLGTGVIAAAGAPSVAAGRRAPKPEPAAAKPARSAPVRVASSAAVAAEPASRTEGSTRIAQAAAEPRVSRAASSAPATARNQCRIDLERAQVELAQAQVALKQVQLDLAQTRLGLEQAELDVVQASVDRDQASLDRDQASTQLAETRSRVEELEGRLGDARSRLADGDADGIPDSADACAETKAGGTVDTSGCSVAQFCATHDVGRDRGRAACWNADFRNDEPLGNPEDCKANRSDCVPR
jgi:hypothetical protein